MHKRYLVVRASGGLSNRLQAILGGIAYCLLTGRTLCVDWRDGLYSDDFSNVFSLWFTLKDLPTASCQEVEEAFHVGATLAPSFWQKHLSDAIAVEYLFAGDEHMSPEGRKQSHFDICHADAVTTDAQEADILVYWGWDLSAVQALAPQLKARLPQYASLEVENIPCAVLKNHIHPTQAVQQEVEFFYHTHFSTPPLGIHIRHSDLQSPLPRMLEKLHHIYIQNQGLFLCTDNELVEKMVRRIYPHCVIRNKLFQGVNVPLHNYVPGISNVKKGFDAVVEMLLLAKCQQIIHYAPSSFARISILYSALPPHAIHAVT